MKIDAARIVTLTTDFGSRDPYAAAMKGAIFSVDRTLTVVDLTHEIPPQGIYEGSLFLAGALTYFPKGTVHVAVVDPGVGTERHPIALRAGGHVLLCPDNGLATFFLRDRLLDEARVISNPAYIAERVSPTFHGRDIFAPAAAHLASGANFADIGDEIDTVTMLDLLSPTGDEFKGIEGEIIHIDRFGNCVTNIYTATLKGATPVSVRVGRSRRLRICRTYGDAPFGEPLALFGSSGLLEIAVNGGNAAAALSLNAGSPVFVAF
jgi:S-adenosylmethionine hydrolase